MQIEYNNALIEYLHDLNPHAQGIFMKPSDAVFEENVKMNCFYCSKYGNNWRCPPNLPCLDYPKMFREFDEGLFVVLKYVFSSNGDYVIARRESSISLHKILLSLEKWMWLHNRATALSFGGGSCKLCKNGCGVNSCNNPAMSRSPLEETGCNIIKTIKKYDININFPPMKFLTRVGLLLWQN